jgi:hypothetical protein
MFFTALYISSNLEKRTGQNWERYWKVLVFSWLAFLTFIYPITAYSTEAMYSYPSSELAGMKFLGSHILDDKILTWRPNRLVAFMKTNIYVAQEFPTESIRENSLLSSYFETATIIAFPRSAYFERALMIDLSFVNNQYSQALNYVEESYKFNKVYSSPGYQIFMRTQE